MRFITITILIIAITTLTNCASGYKMIKPKSINYISSNATDSVKLEYKYDLLNKKYAKKELKRGIKLVAVKVTNNSGRDLLFGKDTKLIYKNGTEVQTVDSKMAFKSLKQMPASYLLYLLLTPLNLHVTKTDSNGFQEETSSTPIGLILGPGLAAGNMIAAAGANKNFSTEMEEYSILGTLIKNGDTKYGLIGIRSRSFDSLMLKIE